MICNTYTNGGEIKTKKLTSFQLVYVLKRLYLKSKIYKSYKQLHACDNPLTSLLQAYDKPDVSCFVHEGFLSVGLTKIRRLIHYLAWSKILLIHFNLISIFLIGLVSIWFVTSEKVHFIQ